MRDKLGREIRVGCVIVYPRHSDYNGTWMGTGTVTKIFDGCRLRHGTSNRWDMPPYIIVTGGTESRKRRVSKISEVVVVSGSGVDK